VRLKCPTCSRVAEGRPEELPYRPFCSERCRSVDLGNWLDAAYRISAPASEEDLDEGLPTDGESVVTKNPPN
jgi:endogenous inhibitor of DNA gyrase (YacG/DUF329 family)